MCEEAARLLGLRTSALSAFITPRVTGRNRTIPAKLSIDSGNWYGANFPYKTNTLGQLSYGGSAFCRTGWHENGGECARKIGGSVATQRSARKAHQTAADKPPAHAQDQIQLLAYQIWLERGAPIGSPETDWLEAEARLGPARDEQA